MRSPRRTAPTTIARATPGSLAGFRTMSRAEGLLASRAKMKKLDSLFTVSSVIEGGDSPDISGPDSKPTATNRATIFCVLHDAGAAVEDGRQGPRGAHDALPRPGGRIVGQRGRGSMSAWYVLSSLGMYEAEPAGGRYWFDRRLRPGRRSWRCSRSRPRTTCW